MIDKSIKFEDFQSTDFNDLIEMGQALWKDLTQKNLIEQIGQFIAEKEPKIILAKNGKNASLGFVMFSIRTDYVEGADKSPTGYLEGIYVKQAYRKKGIAKNFMRIGEDWLRENNCGQLGSDTWLDHQESRNFHKKMGFWEEDVLVHFLKNLD